MSNVVISGAGMEIYRVEQKNPCPEEREKGNDPPPPIPLGHRGEHLARRVVFDISGWVTAYGAGTVRLLHQRQGDAAPYPVTVRRTDADMETLNAETGTLVLWDVTNADTAKACQYGKAELRYYAGETLVKSELYKTAVTNALGSETADAPEAQRDWLDTLLDAAGRIADADAAAQTAQAAATAANAAKTEAETLKDDTQALYDSVSEMVSNIEEAVSNISLSAVPFHNAEAVSIPDGGTFVTVLSATFSAKANAALQVQAEIPLNVTTTADGDAVNGWNALSQAVVTARYLLDGAAWAGTPAQAMDSGPHILALQRYFNVEREGVHTLAAQLSITGGTASVTAGNAVLGLSGIRRE